MTSNDRYRVCFFRATRRFVKYGSGRKKKRRAQRIGRRPIAGPQKRPLFDGIIAGVDERDAIRARDGAHIEANFSFLRFVLILCFNALGL